MAVLMGDLRRSGDEAVPPQRRPGPTSGTQTTNWSRSTVPPSMGGVSVHSTGVETRVGLSAIHDRKSAAKLDLGPFRVLKRTNAMSLTRTKKGLQQEGLQNVGV